MLAFQDPESARIFSERADVLPSTLMATPVDHSWLFVRGRAPQQVERFRLEDHPLYAELPEAQSAQNEFDLRRRHATHRIRPTTEKGPVSQRIRAPSVMTYLGNKDYLR